MPQHEYNFGSGISETSFNIDGPGSREEFVVDTVAAYLERQESVDDYLACTVPLEEVAFVNSDAAWLHKVGWQACGFHLEVVHYEEDRMDELNELDLSHDQAQMISNQIGLESYLVLRRPIFELSDQSKRLFEHAISDDDKKQAAAFIGPCVLVVLHSSGCKKVFSDEFSSYEGSPSHYDYFEFPWETNAIDSEFDIEGISADEWQVIERLEKTLHSEAVQQIIIEAQAKSPEPESA